jgi:hypothetical protein
MPVSVTKNQPRTLVAADILIPRLPTKGLGPAIGAVGVVVLLLAPTPAQALVSGNPCSTYSSSLVLGDSCTITDGADTYKISITNGTFRSVFPSPDTSNMFWWGSSAKATSAANQVGLAWGITQPGASYLGPYFAWSEINTFPFDINARAYTTPDFYLGSVVEPKTIDQRTTGIWASSSLLAVESVPAPLPILGIPAVFAFSRKLKKRIKLHKGTSNAAATPAA